MTLLSVLSANNLLPNNPGYLVTIPQPLIKVNMNAGQGQNVINISAGSTKKLWLLDFDFNTHPEISVDGKYVTAVSYIQISPADNSLIAVQNSLYLNHIGVIICGGTTGQTYTVTAAATLNNSQVLTFGIKITIGQ